MPSTTRRGVLAAAGGLVGSLAGCSAIDDESWPIATDWHGGLRDPSSVAVTDAGRLIAGSRGPFDDQPIVAQLDESTGEVTWSVEVSKGRRSPLSVRGDRAYAASEAGVAVAVDTTAGETVWRTPLGRVDAADPGVFDFAPLPLADRVVVPISGTEDDVPDRLTGLGRANGERLFDRRLAASLSGAPAAVSGLGGDDDTADGVVAPLLDGRLLGVAADGTLAWELEIGTTSSAVGTADGVAYLGTADEELLAVATDSGTVQWRADLANTVFARPLVTDDRVYVGGADYHLRAFDADSGEQLWRDELDNAVTHGPVAVGDRLVTLVGGEHRVRGSSGTIPYRPTVLYVHERDGTRVRTVRFSGSHIEGGSVEWLQAAGDTVYLGQTFGLTRVTAEAITDA